MNPLVQAYNYACDRINSLGRAYEYEEAHENREAVLEHLASNQAALIGEWVLDDEMRERMYHKDS